VTEKQLQWKHTHLQQWLPARSTCTGVMGVVLMGWSPAQSQTAAAGAAAGAGGAEVQAPAPTAPSSSASAASSASAGTESSAPSAAASTAAAEPASTTAAARASTTQRVFQLPYSSHSSYSELRAFVGRVRPRHITLTVKNPSYFGWSKCNEQSVVKKCFGDLLHPSKPVRFSRNIRRRGEAQMLTAECGVL
jgi:hypothetical protein